ncbi:MAG: hypothetical protein NPIRA03_22630 [Nitrospirales bacterium]|nr:MAG: hypothetical protein NPIRA03_22630 [Nitrospirales bacterium]
MLQISKVAEGATLQTLFPEIPELGPLNRIGLCFLMAKVEVYWRDGTFGYV